MKILVKTSELIHHIISLLDENKEVILKARGQSMFPFIIGDRDDLVLKKKKEYNKGDIVLAEIKPNLFVIHRIIKINNESVVLMGDGNIKTKEYCKEHNIHGCVIKILKEAKEINNNSKKQRILARLWWFIRPFRRIILYFCRKQRLIN